MITFHAAPLHWILFLDPRRVYKKDKYFGSVLVDGQDPLPTIKEKKLWMDKHPVCSLLHVRLLGDLAAEVRSQYPIDELLDFDRSQSLAIMREHWDADDESVVDSLSEPVVFAEPLPAVPKPQKIVKPKVKKPYFAGRQISELTLDIIRLYTSEPKLEQQEIASRCGVSKRRVHQICHNFRRNMYSQRSMSRLSCSSTCQ